MSKKSAKKPGKTMSKKGMKKTKGGLIGMLLPAVQTNPLSPRDPQISGNTINGGISGNSFTGGL